MSDPIRASTSGTASSSHRHLSFRKIALMACPNLRMSAFSYQRVSTLPPRSTRSSLLPLPAALRRPSAEPQRFRHPSFGRSVGGGGDACAPRGTLSAPSGVTYGGNPEPYNGLSYSWRPRRRHLQRDGNPYPEYSPFGTAPPSPPRSYSTSSCPGAMSAGAVGTAPAYP